MVVAIRPGLETETTRGAARRLNRRQRAGDRGPARPPAVELLRRRGGGDPDPSRQHRRRGDGRTRRPPGGLPQPPLGGEDDVGRDGNNLVDAAWTRVASVSPW